MDIDSIRKLNITDIIKRIKEEELNLSKKTMDIRLAISQKSSSEGINSSVIGKMKKDISRLKTVLSEKKYLTTLNNENGEKSEK